MLEDLISWCPNYRCMVLRIQKKSGRKEELEVGENGGNLHTKLTNCGKRRNRYLTWPHLFINLQPWRQRLDQSLVPHAHQMAFRYVSMPFWDFIMHRLFNLKSCNICETFFVFSFTGHIKNTPSSNELNRFAWPAMDTILGSFTKLNHANIERRQLLTKSYSV